MPLSYLNDPNLKAHWLARAAADPSLGAEREPTIALEAAARPDRVIPDVFGGCAALAAIEGELFVHMPDADCASWPYRLFDAIPVGVCLAPAIDRFFRDLLRDPDTGLAALSPSAAAPAQAMAALYDQRLTGQEPAREDWVNARKQADALGSGLLSSAIWAAGYYPLDRHAPAEAPTSLTESANSAWNVMYYSVNAARSAGADYTEFQDHIGAWAELLLNALRASGPPTNPTVPAQGEGPR